MNTAPLVIGVTGPCAAGKSTLAIGLEKKGYTVKHIAQEHSFVPDMWYKIAKPDILIFLDVSYAVAKQRQGAGKWQRSLYQKQVTRLRHARKHADLLLNTDNLSPEEVLQNVLGYLKKIG
ncbi:MAG: hypothetical protein U9O54_07405 [Chloroflexota bacterium]|nr:hypothetical protein [Chloroflexota bacterium]